LKRSGSSAARLAIIGLCLLAWGAHLPLRLSRGPRISPDSAAYIECARNIAEGRGFVVGDEAGRLTDGRWHAMRSWPPGYPLLVAAVMRLGPSAADAAPAAAAISAAAFLAVLAGFCLGRFPTAVALCLALTAASMHSLLTISAMSWSDAPYLAFAAASLVCLAKSERATGGAPFWILAAGLTGGFAWCIRNVAVALFGASVFLLACRALWLPAWRAAKDGLLWLAAWGAACSWLVCRNLVVFGSVNPYNLPASDRPFGQNVHDAIVVVFRDMSVTHPVEDVLGAAYALVPIGAVTLLAAAGLLVASRCVRRHSWPESREWLRTHQGVVLFSAYVILYMATVVVARSVYAWGETIHSRHCVQVYWLLWVLFAMGGLAACRRLFREERNATIAMVVVLAGTTVLQAGGSVYKTWSLKGEKGIGGDVRLAQRIGSEVQNDQIVLASSNIVPALRVYGAVNARWMDRSDLRGEPLTRAEIRQAGVEGRLWGIVVTRPQECLRGEYGDAVREIALNPGVLGFQEITLGKQSSAYRWVGLAVDPRRRGSE